MMLILDRKLAGVMSFHELSSWIQFQFWKIAKRLWSQSWKTCWTSSWGQRLLRSFFWQRCCVRRSTQCVLHVKSRLRPTMKNIWITYCKSSLLSWGKNDWTFKWSHQSEPPALRQDCMGLLSSSTTILGCLIWPPQLVSRPLFAISHFMGPLVGFTTPKKYIYNT